MVLSLKYGDLSGTISASKKLVDELGQYCDDLSRKVQNKMYSVEGGTSSALESADYFVSQKITQLRKRENNARELSVKTQTLLDTAKRVDTAVVQMLQGEQKRLFQNNTDLEPPSWKSKIVAFLCDMKNVPILGGLIKAGEKVLGAMEQLCKDIKDWYVNGGGKEICKVILASLAVVAIAVLCILTAGALPAALAAIGGVLKVIAAGLIIGLISQIISDTISVTLGGEWSTWESYVGTSVGTAIGITVSVYTKNWTLGDGVSAGMSTLITNCLENATGRSNKSWQVITGETIISTALAASISGIFKAVSGNKTVKNLTDNWVAQLFDPGRKAGVTIGKGSMVGAFRGQLSKLATGATQQLHFKTIRNGFVYISEKLFIDKLNKKFVNSITDFIMDKAVMPFISADNLAPLFDWKIVVPNGSIDNYNAIKRMYKLLPAK
jgi:hypothetical protein